MIYSQTWGTLYSVDGTFIGTGYAGNGAGLDNPDMQTVVDHGPLPGAPLDPPDHLGPHGWSSAATWRRPSRWPKSWHSSRSITHSQELRRSPSVRGQMLLTFQSCEQLTAKHGLVTWVTL